MALGLSRGAGGKSRNPAVAVNHGAWGRRVRQNVVLLRADQRLSEVKKNWSYHSSEQQPIKKQKTLYLNAVDIWNAWSFWLSVAPEIARDIGFTRGSAGSMPLVQPCLVTWYCPVSLMNKYELVVALRYLSWAREVLALIKYQVKVF